MDLGALISSGVGVGEAKMRGRDAVKQIMMLMVSLVLK